MSKLAHQQNTLCRHSVTAANSRTELLFVDKIVVVVVGVVVVAAAAAAAAAAAVVCCMCLGYDAYIVRTRIHKQWDLALPGILPSEPRDTEPDWSLRLQYVHSTQNSKREKKRYIFQQYSFSYVPTRIPLFCTYRTVVPVKYLVLVVFRSTVLPVNSTTHMTKGGVQRLLSVSAQEAGSLFTSRTTSTISCGCLAAGTTVRIFAKWFVLSSCPNVRLAQQQKLHQVCSLS